MPLGSYEPVFLCYNGFQEDEVMIKEKIDNITKHLNKIKVPVRPNRHFQRWGRIMKSPPSYRFRLDGRNNPKYRRYQSALMTVAP